MRTHNLRHQHDTLYGVLAVLVTLVILAICALYGALAGP